MPNLISIADLSSTAIDGMLDKAEQLWDTPPHGEELRNKIISLLFFEPSTRTNLSFSAATQRLGAGVIGFQNAASSSAVKGESLEDTIRVCSELSDVVVLRHVEDGSAARAAAVATVPVVNAGDGTNEHPTQTLCDLLAIRRRHGRLHDLDIAIAGDLKHGRTVNSLSAALAHRNNRFHFVASPELQTSDASVGALEAAGSTVTRHQQLDGIIGDLDVVYVTRMQKERWSGNSQAGDSPKVTVELLQSAKASLAVLHPLPRNEEIDPAIDSDPRAAYFDQVAGSVPIRMAVLLYALGIVQL